MPHPGGSSCAIRQARGVNTRRGGRRGSLAREMALAMAGSLPVWVSPASIFLFSRR